MSKELEVLKELRNDISIGALMFSDDKLDIIETALKTLEILKEICLEGKDKYGKGTWGWVEFDLDKEPELKEWLKDD